MDALLLEPIPNDVVYEEEALKYRRSLESEPNMMPDSEYMASQKFLKPKLRQGVVNILTSRAHTIIPDTFPGTLLLAVAIFDRYASKGKVEQDTMMPVGLASLLIAMKYNHSSWEPDIKEFTKDGMCNGAELVAFEREVLDKLDFTPSTPTALTFFRAFTKDISQNPLTKMFTSLGHYMAGLALLDIEMLKYKPSLIAASIIFLSNLTLKMRPWNELLQTRSGYTPDDLRSCVLKLHNLQKGFGYEGRESTIPVELPIKVIYSKEENYCVATLQTVDISDKYFENTYE